MTRASFKCPVTEEECDKPNCRRSFAHWKARVAIEEKMLEERQRLQRLKKARDSGDIYGLLDELGLRRPRIKRRRM